MPRKSATADARILRAGVYLELDLYDLFATHAAQNGAAFSTWARQVLIEELVRQKAIPQETLVKLAIGANGKATPSNTGTAA